MQLGTRWRLGAEPPKTVPDAVREALRIIETEVSSTVPGSDQWRWTLTWLEGRPVVELDDGTTIRVDPITGEARVTAYLDDVDEE